MTTRTLIADDHAYFRSVLRELLERCGDIEIVAEAVDGCGAVALAAQHEPDLVLMDVNMPELDGVAACSRMKAASPDTPVILYSASDISALVARTATAANALLGKQDLFTDLPPLLKQIASEQQSRKNS